MLPFAIPFPSIDPVALEIGPLAIRWYALAYIAGILLGWWYSRRLVMNDRLWGGSPRPTPEEMDDFIVYATVGIVLGGRVGYVLFYNPAYYLQHPVEALMVWRGGMSFHGGLLGSILAMALFRRGRPFPVLTLFDIFAASTTFGLFFGRLANFINSELWGRPAEVPWAMVFPTGGPLARHPSQLYEAALEGVVLFLVLRVMTHRLGALQRPGVVAGAFVAGYGLARTVVEHFREPDAHIGYIGGVITMGQILSLPMLVGGLMLMIWAARRPRPA
ncbi:prolipoprotein diacylglyceryl transferase [Prosthecomicrobium sp. N25]|uniref:prolipoprotein diacylglyceryl transferase n=1 Tax=Prosthecomicrobium sp. N25 TaxID=3129254 RepID=UPI0030784540